jgi:CubicO group peptidase (beta-lactamase class C family)
MDGHYTQADVVIVNDRLIYERYRGIGTLETEALESAGWGQLDALYRARNSDSLANSWSMAKSVTSLLVGIASDRGEMESLDESASNYIPAWANDARKDISIANLLDMRYGLEPMCIDFFSGDLQPCMSAKDAEAGGDIYYADDQLSGSLARSLDLAEPGIAVCANLKVGSFLYSNCDSMALAETLFQATGKDLQDYADRYLFSPLNITALWRRDNVEVGQRAGNYIGHYCLDA